MAAIVDTARCPRCAALLGLPANFRRGECPWCGAHVGSPSRHNPDFASPDDIPRNTAVRAFFASSHTPDRRGEQVRSEYAQYLNQIYDELHGQAADEELQRFRAGYLKRYQAWLHAHSRVASAFITGPSKFPVERNRKAHDTEHKRLTELREFATRGEAALRRSAAGKQFINVGDAGAAETLGGRRAEELSDLEIMKAANALYRKLAGKVSQDEAERQVRSSLPDKWTRDAFGSARTFRFAPGSRSYVPFADYELTNARARAKRLEGQAQVAERMAATPTREYSGDGVTIIDNADAGRVQILFPGKPEKAMIEQLKGNGWRWAPSEGAWQRHRTDQALRDAAELTGMSLAAPVAPPALPFGTKALRSELRGEQLPLFNPRQPSRRNPLAATGEETAAERRYESFHGVAPHKRSEVDVGEMPTVWWKIGDGAGGAVEYTPPSYSERAPDVYRHEWGDLGSRHQRSKAKVFVSGDGRWLLASGQLPGDRPRDRGVDDGKCCTAHNERAQVRPLALLGGRPPRVAGRRL
ncbi:MAG: hypothetical protein NTZ05_12445 [Chloroflexi bacterium]|nr:hypothetical protein [Chloroflexota bacterium]